MLIEEEEMLGKSVEKILIIISVCFLFGIYYFRRSEGRFNDNTSVISNVLLNQLAGMHRRPVSRVSWRRFERIFSYVH